MSAHLESLPRLAFPHPELCWGCRQGHIWTAQPHQHPLGSLYPTESARCPVGNALFIRPLEPGMEKVNKY